jgi:hypothetical protein
VQWIYLQGAVPSLPRSFFKPLGLGKFAKEFLGNTATKCPSLRQHLEAHPTFQAASSTVGKLTPHMGGAFLKNNSRDSKSFVQQFCVVLLEVLAFHAAWACSDPPLFMFMPAADGTEKAWSWAAFNAEFGPLPDVDANAQLAHVAQCWSKCLHSNGSSGGTIAKKLFNYKVTDTAPSVVSGCSMQDGTQLRYTIDGRYKQISPDQQHQHLPQQVPEAAEPAHVEHAAADRVAASGASRAEPPMPGAPAHQPAEEGIVPLLPVRDKPSAPAPPALHDTQAVPLQLAASASQPASQAQKRKREHACGHSSQAAQWQRSFQSQIRHTHLEQLDDAPMQQSAARRLHNSDVKVKQEPGLATAAAGRASAGVVVKQEPEAAPAAAEAAASAETGPAEAGL